MKGIVFTELIEMVEQQLGLETADHMICNASLKNEGAFTCVGTYDHDELIKMVVALSQETGVPASELVQTFGKYLFGRFAELYPQFFEGITGSIEFLRNVDRYIHVEVKKLYPDAQLPKFDIVEHENGTTEMIYSSQRPFADLAEGLIVACVSYFDDQVGVQRTNLGEQDGTHASFTLTPNTSVIKAPGVVGCPFGSVQQTTEQ